MAVKPGRGRVRAEALGEFGQQIVWAGVRRDTGVVGAPVDQTLDRFAGLIEVEIGRVKDDATYVAAGEEGPAGGAVLPDLVGLLIKTDRGPALGVIGREAGAKVLAGQAGVLGGAVIELEAGAGLA